MKSLSCVVYSRQPMTLTPEPVFCHRYVMLGGDKKPGAKISGSEPNNNGQPVKPCLVSHHSVQTPLLNLSRLEDVSH